ncbi:reverse transcriptase [Trichonephila clavipes]|uniref:Reverse transcriptase n=1 Tax=Trichonephila clavipes TaxID=2585209 RepID=A0A8X6W704_TRICX|nr:reverse transcriptase [Trichonephila clavipes]
MLFEGSLVVEKNVANNDGEVLAVCEAATHLLYAGLAPAKSVFFIDSQTAILALSSNTPTALTQLSAELKLQSSSHMVGLRPYSGSQVMLGSSAMKEPTEAKQGAESTQPEVPLALGRAKSIISTHIDKYTAMIQKTKSFEKPWETLATVSPILRHLKRAEAVARFHPTTGHDLLGVYLHWLGVAANEACPLCGFARMDGDHLLQCTGLVEYPADDIVSRYWEARCQMVKTPSTGVG